MRDCSTCERYLGAGQCRDNLERECADGEYEAWQARTTFRSPYEASMYLSQIGYMGGWDLRYEPESKHYRMKTTEEIRN